MEEICFSSFCRECRFKDKCDHILYHLPYKWQILDQNGTTWNDLQNEEVIEEAFCNPTNDVSPGSQSVDFTSMTCGGARVRRLSTASSVIKPPDFILTTEWHWYWKNDDGHWIEYGQGFDEEHAVPLTSAKLEKLYQDDPQSEISADSATNKYKLNLKDMYQQNILYKTKREIRRRPWFVSAQEVESKLKSERSSSSSEMVPAHWDKEALSNSYTLVTLTRADTDFLVIEKLFKKTMPECAVTSIQRNQNCFLWKMFLGQKEQMKKRNGGRDVDERLLFHGTDSSLIDDICEQNFDWRISGKHATLYGKGSYFARDASYSDHYSNTSDDYKKIMFVARVLVGLYTCGQSNFVRPPPKSPAKGYYDSCVDDENDPSIFVIFEKYQIYPEFIIEYGPWGYRCLIS